MNTEDTRITALVSWVVILTLFGIGLWSVYEIVVRVLEIL